MDKQISTEEQVTCEHDTIAKLDTDVWECDWCGLEFAPKEAHGESAVVSAGHITTRTVCILSTGEDLFARIVPAKRKMMICQSAQNAYAEAKDVTLVMMIAGFVM